MADPLDALRLPVVRVGPRHEFAQRLRRRLDGLAGTGPAQVREADMEHAANPSVTPMLTYEDGSAALEWLARVFGFRERMRLGEGERIGHAEMVMGTGVIMIAGWGVGGDYESPKRLREIHEPARRAAATPYVIDGVHVVVEDVDAHFERARSQGAKILSEPRDEPYGRGYRVEDLEGHRWMFMQLPKTREEAPGQGASSEEG